MKDRIFDMTLIFNFILFNHETFIIETFSFIFLREECNHFANSVTNPHIAVLLFRYSLD